MGSVSDESVRAMRDAGCTEDGISRVVKLWTRDCKDEAMLELRRHRAKLMDELHEQQAKVDAIDFLVRKMKDHRTEK